MRKPMRMSAALAAKIGAERIALASADLVRASLLCLILQDQHALAVFIHATDDNSVWIMPRRAWDA